MKTKIAILNYEAGCVSLVTVDNDEIATKWNGSIDEYIFGSPGKGGLGYSESQVSWMHGEDLWLDMHW